jgi:hypothetical protein
MGIRLIIGFFVVDPVLSHPLHGAALKGKHTAKGEKVLHPLVGLKTPMRQKSMKAECDSEHSSREIQDNTEDQARSTKVTGIKGKQRSYVNECDDENCTPLNPTLTLAVDGKTALI